MEKTYLSTFQREERIKFACKNRELNWMNVIFCGEAKFRKINIWGSLDMFGPIKQRFAIGQFTGEQYLGILNETILPMHNENSNENCIFLQVKI